MLRVTVWGENVHEQQDAAVAAIYPRGMHTAIAEGIRENLPNAEVVTATLQEAEHGLTAERLWGALSWGQHVALSLGGAGLIAAGLFALWRRRLR